MQLIIKQLDGATQQLQFQRGPIYIGRQMGSQVFLPDTRVSRQHAVIYTTKEGGWVIEDLESANKTFLDDDAIHKSELKDGSIIRIAEFSIAVQLDKHKTTKPEPPTHMEDTFVTVRHDLHIETRKLSGEHVPAITFPAKRAKEYAAAAGTIYQTTNIDQLHREMVDIILRQFAAMHAWVGLRTIPEGPIQCQGGRKVNREMVKRSDLAVQQIVSDAIDKCKYMIVPQVPRQIADGKVRSAIVAPVIKDKKCYGAMYADNAKEHEHYTSQDLDYLILLSITTATKLGNL
jgi:pSer/pThr/pTyr-binding forkhead associated (FHA) protein